MKSIRKYIAIIVAVGVLGVAGAVYAAELKTPADLVSSLTGKSVSDLNKEREAGKTYGTIAKEAGKLDEFKTQMLEQKKAILDERVKDGRLTQTQADEVYNAIKNNQTTCDGTGSAGIGRKGGARFGQGNGMGKGAGMGNGCGMGKGMGNRTK